MKRSWITFLRICRYGFSSFTRNAWLSTAATIVMVVTLMILLTTFTARMVFNDTLSKIREKIDVSVYLSDEITDEQRDNFVAAIKGLEIVTNVDYISKAQARDVFKDQNKAYFEQLEALGELGETNPFPASLRIYTNDPDRLDEISTLVNSVDYTPLQSEPASISGERRAAIDTIARAAKFSEIAGIVALVVFVTLSIMIIFNTIRMAIFNRRDEIEIMKLIGASKNFIRGPFIVEASLYGVFAAIITIVLMYGVLLTVGPNLTNYDIEVSHTLAVFANWPIVIFSALLGVGIMIGVISSFLAIRRYLKL
ncbi:MAG TPA: permease-like cell division protein FtsX [Candidatus Saccharimonadales bacterium]|nr:permease-like cell division protein FtsX [Candidatus Saccharimonadales bacterium]